MLFLAVFCGFLAEYQLEHKIEKQRAKEFAFSLYRDITADTLAFNRNINNLNICVTKIDSLIELLGNKDEIVKNTALIHRLSIYAFIFPQNKPNESTIQQLLNSGSLRYFRSSRLVDSVKDYNSEIQLYKEFREDIGAFNIESRKVQASVLDMNPIIVAISNGGFLAQEKTGLDPVIFADTQPMTTDPLLVKEYANWCALKKFYISRTAVQFHTLNRRAGGVLQILKDEYHFK